MPSQPLLQRTAPRPSLVHALIPAGCDFIDTPGPNGVMVHAPVAALVTQALQYPLILTTLWPLREDLVVTANWTSVRRGGRVVINTLHVHMVGPVELELLIAFMPADPVHVLLRQSIAESGVLGLACQPTIAGRNYSKMPVLWLTPEAES